MGASGRLEGNAVTPVKEAFRAAAVRGVDVAADIATIATKAMRTVAAATRTCSLVATGSR